MPHKNKLIILPFLFNKKFEGIAIYPFIILKDKKWKNNMILIQHEQIHLQQQRELLLVFFYIWYLIEFIILLINYRDFDKAYHSISFEREAYDHENTVDYLKYRKRFHFFSYYKNKEIK